MATKSTAKKATVRKTTERSTDPSQVSKGDTCVLCEEAAVVKLGSPRGGGKYAYVPVCKGHEAAYYDNIPAVRQAVRNG